MQERRVIEYVVLGDAATAVGILLASTPEKSARYYRDALCTLALAVQPHLCAQCACIRAKNFKTHKNNSIVPKLSRGFQDFTDPSFD